MGYPTKVQLISRKKGADQYYINFPTAVAEAMEFQKGEIIEWIIENKANNEIQHQYLASDKVGRILGWEPTYSLESGLQETLAWYLEFLAGQPQ